MFPCLIHCAFLSTFSGCYPNATSSSAHKDLTRSGAVDVCNLWYLKQSMENKGKLVPNRSNSELVLLNFNSGCFHCQIVHLNRDTGVTNEAVDIDSS